MNFFSSVFPSCYPAVIVIETWLSSEIHSSDFFPNNYSLFRNGRPETGPKQKGGGALIAADSSVQCVRRSGLEAVGESVWLELTLT